MYKDIYSFNNYTRHNFIINKNRRILTYNILFLLRYIRRTNNNDNIGEVSFILFLLTLASTLSVLYLLLVWRKYIKWEIIFFIKSEKLLVLCRAGEPEPVGAGCSWLLGAGAAWKKTRSRSRLGKKNQEPEPEPLEKKVRSRSRKKICRLPSPEQIKKKYYVYLPK